MQYFKFIVPFFLLCCFHVKSQEDIAKTAIYLELLGNGGVYSLNVERKLGSNFHGRIGYGSWTSQDFFEFGESSFVTFPVMGNVLLGQGSSKLEVGGGFLLGHYTFESAFGEENDRKSILFDFTAVVGYRYQKSEGGFMGRIGLTPFLSLNDDEDAYPDSGLSISGGISIGYSF